MTASIFKGTSAIIVILCFCVIGVLAHQISGATGFDGLPEGAQSLATGGPDQRKKTETAEGGHDLHGDPLPPGTLARLGTVRFRPRDTVTSVAFTPDGKQLLTHESSGGVKIWDAVSGKDVGGIPAESANILGEPLLTPDGRSVVTLERGKQSLIRVRNRADLKVIREFPVSNFPVGGADRGVIHSPRLTRDGRLLVTVFDGVGNARQPGVEVWDFETGQQIRACKAHAGRIWCVDLSADGKTLGTADPSDEVRIWDLATGKLRRECVGYPNVALHGAQ